MPTGYALLSANLPQIQGSLGLTLVRGRWLSAVYVTTNVSSNLIPFKARQQFGIRQFAEIALVAYLLLAGAYLLLERYEATLMARLVAGFAAAPLSALALFYILQAFPKAYMGSGLCVALGVSRFWIPVAWLLSPTLLDLGDWQTLYLFEFGLAVCSLAACVVLKLPLGIRIAVFEWRDFVTFTLVGGVLAQGSTQWWTEQPWMAIALIAAFGLFIAGFYLEHSRANPLLQTRWLGSAGALRLEVARFVCTGSRSG